jgi:hypothetical protein
MLYLAQWNTVFFHESDVCMSTQARDAVDIDCRSISPHLANVSLRRAASQS